MFGYQVGKIIPHKLDSKELENSISASLNDGIRLLYWFIDPDDNVSNKAAIENKGILVDQKTTYLKKIEEKNYFTSSNIVSYLHTPLNKKILSLAYQSAEYSRFRVDLNFKNNESEHLYKAWIEKSLSGEIAEDVLVYYDQQEELGLITLGEKSKRADIGLLAVDRDARGKSIGTHLIQAALAKADQSGYKEIQVVTQGKNTIACSFYEKNGFVKDYIQNIYHFWI